MSCNKCGSNPCGCAVTLCGGCKTPSSCSSQGSCCQNIVPAAPAPFYACPNICAEDHCKTEIKAAFAASVKIQNSFNMPACGASAQLAISGLISISVGAYLWNQAFGYLQVIAFDAYTQLVTVQNNCNVGNAAPGTTVPACTLFVVTDPPSASGGSSPTGIFVAVDFTAPAVCPAVGCCILITVTGVTGIAVNKNVQIGSGTYRVDAIPDSTHLIICNDGAGITPGSSVVAKDGAGEYQYPIVLIDVNACTNTPVLEGALLTCFNDIQQPLIAPSPGMVPVSTATPNQFKAEFLEVPTRTCATIPCCFTIVSGFAGPYIIEVSDTSEFLVGDILQIGTRTDRFTVTVVIDGTHLQGTISPVPGATTEIAIGTSICIIDCCEDLQNQVDDINTELTDINNEIDLIRANNTVQLVNETAGDPTDVTVDSGAPTYSFTEISLFNTFNPNAQSTMLYNLTLLGRFFGNTDNRPGTFRFTLEYLITYGSPAGVIGPVAYGFEKSWVDGNDNAVARADDYFISVPISFDLLAGRSVTITATAKVEYVAGASISYNLFSPPLGNSIELSLTGIGVSQVP